MPISLVTGGAGFIGSHIVDALLQRGDQVRVVDNLVTGKMSNLAHVQHDIEFIKADICDPNALATAFTGVDTVFHQAALASVPLSVEKPLVVNHACVTGTLNVLNVARKAGVRRVVYAGSSSCYGDRPFSANRETDVPLTMSPYAVAKLAGEHYCHAFYQTYGFETVCLRYFNVFGPRQDPTSHYSAVIPLFITWMLAGKAPVVYGDGQQSRDFCFVEDVVRGNLLAADATGVAGKSFNLATGRSTTILQLIGTIQELLRIDVAPDFQPARPGDIRDSLADISAAVRQLGFEPQIDFETGLARSIEYYKSVIEQPAA